MQNDDELIQRVTASIEDLNVRIARLASALHVPLDDQAALSLLMAWHSEPPLVNERRSTPTWRASVRAGVERRQNHLREELRGLLVLRYHLETNSLNDNGLTVTHEAMVQAEEHLLRRGFKPGADGLHLDEFFNEP
ncbi:MAG: hypothetical protein PSV24_10725 [Rhodoferax sp.]|nr:hypothetical protein [Rhodoferax sp.]